MEFTSDQLKQVSGPNARLAIWGRFSCQDGAPRYFFHKAPRDGSPARQLNGLNFFEVLAPELRFVYDPTNPEQKIEIGDLSYRKFDIYTPADAESLEGHQTRPTRPMPVLKDSLLLDRPGSEAGQDSHEIIQKIGGDLFKQLVQHLDVTVRFGHGHFAKALTSILYLYVPTKSAQRTNEVAVSQDDFQELLQNDVVLRAEFIKYLLCLSDDEAEVEKSLQSMLSETVGEPGSPFNSRKEVGLRQISTVLQVANELKRGLYDDSRSVRNFLEQQRLFWIADIELDQQFSFAYPETGKGGDFFALYQTYRNSADWIARFVRTEVQHAYLFCWLASKFKTHYSGNRRGATAEMFKRTIKNQAQRRFGENRQELIRNLQDIGEEARNAGGEGSQEFRMQLRIAEERLKSYFLPAHNYTREQVIEHTRKLYVHCASLAGGLSEGMQAKSRELSDALICIRQPLLALIQEYKKKNGGESQVSMDEFFKSVRTKVDNDTDFKRLDDYGKSTVKTFLCDWQKGLTTELSVQDLKTSYVKNLAWKVFEDLAENWKQSEKDRREEEAEFTALFNLQHKISGEPNRDAPGLWTNMVTDFTLDAELRSGVQPDAQKNRLSSKLSVSAPSSLHTEMPAQLKADLEAKDAMPSGGEKLEASLEYDGKPFGAVTLDQGGLEFRRDTASERSDAQSSEAIDLKQVSFVINADKENELAVHLHEYDELPVTELVPEPNREASLVIDKYYRITEKENDCHGKYVQATVDDAAYRRSLRTCTLGRAMLAVQRGKINLGAEDLSNNLGVIMAMTEHLGEPEADFYDNREFDEGTRGYELLNNIDLSQFYPLADSDQAAFGSILQYNYTLCDKMQNVREYLDEVRTLSEFFEAMKGSELEVQFVNATLGEYEDGVERGHRDLKLDDHVLIASPPLAIYATRQAKVDAASLGRLRHRIDTSFLNDENYRRKLQLPAVFMDHIPNQNDAATDLDKYRIPVFSSQQVPLPFSRGGLEVPQVATCPNLYFAAALGKAGDHLPFGQRPAHWTAPMQRVLADPEHGYVGWPEKFDVAQYLRHVWNNKAELKGQLIVLKWINAALAVAEHFAPVAPVAGRQDNDTHTNNLSPFLGWLYASNDDAAKQCRDAIFDGLAFADFEAGLRTIKSRESGNTQDKFQTAFTNPCPVPGVEFQIDGTPVNPQWLT